MAEFLIKVTNNTHPDPEKDRRGSYKRGMVVRVERDGFLWGAEETKQSWIAAGRDPLLWPGYFYLVKVPQVTYEQVIALVNTQVTDDSGNLLTDDGGMPITFRRREYVLKIDTLKPSIKAALESAGEVTVAVNEISNDVKRIRDNANYF